MNSTLQMFLIITSLHLTIEKDVGHLSLTRKAVGKSSDNDIFQNCSRNTLESSLVCVCLTYIDGQCTLCCTFQQERCCFPYKCNNCWEDTWKYMTVMQISVSILIFMGIIFVIMIIFKIYEKYTNMRSAQTGCESLRCTCSGTCCCSMHEQIRDRPPNYNEIYEAPPVYNTSLTRQATTFEAPPIYPGLSRVDTSAISLHQVSEEAVSELSSSITHHI